MLTTIRKIRWSEASIALAIAVLAIALWAVSSAAAGADDGQTEGQNDAAPATEKAETKADTTATVKLDGRGRQASEKFKLEKGLFIVRTTHKGSSNFVVRLVNREGEETQGLFNHIGAYDAARGFEVKESGEYLLNVQADGAWTFAIDQPRPTTGEAVPKTIAGNRSDVSPFLALKKGLCVFKYAYKGDGRFAVYLVDDQGRTVEQVVNTLKTTEGSTPIKIEQDGIYFLNTSVQGDWKIDVQQ